MADQSLITLVIQRYFEDWEPPKDTGRDWIPCLCPFHGETNQSASVSYAHDAFNCHGCGVKGDAIAIIRQQEEVTFAEAVRITEELSPGGDRKVQAKPERKPGRRVFGQSEPGIPKHRRGNGQVPSRIRGRSTPWS